MSAKASLLVQEILGSTSKKSGCAVAELEEDYAKWKSEQRDLNATENEFHLNEKNSRDRLAHLESEYGVDRIETATELNLLAQILHQSGKRAEAEKTRKRVFRIIRRQYLRVT